MGVQISGTTVIDDSRNMRNMATVTATSFHGDGSGFTNLPASGGSITATASGSISNGDAVVINTDGTVSSVSGTTITEAVGSEVVHVSTTIYDGGQAVVYDTANDKVVVFYDSGNYIQARVGTVSGTSISYGSEQEAYDGSSTGGPGKINAVYEPNSGKILFSYKRSNNNLHINVATLSGSTLSFGTSVEVLGNRADYNALATDGSGKTVILYADDNNNNYGFAKVVTLSGNTISLGSATTVFGADYVFDIAAAYDASVGRFFFFMASGSNSRVKGNVGSVSGSTLTVGTVTNVDTSSRDTAAAYDPVAKRIVVAYSKYSSSGGRARVVKLSSSDNSFTLGDTIITESSGFADNNKLEYHTAADRMILAYFHNDGADDDGFIRVLTVNADNDTLTSSDKFYFNGDPGSINGGIYMAYDPDTVQIALIYADQDNSSYGTTRMYKPGYNDSNFRRFIGFSDAAYSNGNTATIQITGATDDAQSSLTVGSKNFVLFNGNLSTTADSDATIVAGKALSATEILIGE